MLIRAAGYLSLSLLALACATSSPPTLSALVPPAPELSDLEQACWESFLSAEVATNRYAVVTNDCLSHRGQADRLAQAMFVKGVNASGYADLTSIVAEFDLFFHNLLESDPILKTLEQEYAALWEKKRQAELETTNQFMASLRKNACIRHNIVRPLFSLGYTCAIYNPSWATSIYQERYLSLCRAYSFECSESEVEHNLNQRNGPAFQSSR